jgi:indolepyruvate ferredoxin oxidoreductase alpha subunit
VIKRELDIEEPSVIISRAPCPLMTRQKKQTPFVVHEDICTACGSCLKINCPALTRRDGKAFVNDFLCNGCSVCAQVCGFGAIVRQGEAPAPRAKKAVKETKAKK